MMIMLYIFEVEGFCAGGGLFHAGTIYTPPDRTASIAIPETMSILLGSAYNG